MNRALVVCALMLVPAARASTQTGSMRVTVPSPTAASLGKFGDIPVSLYTGTPDISIPLFTAKGRTLEVPIVLRYHAGGIRVEEIGGWAGLGWTLEAGGAITRTVRGIVDEAPTGYYHTGTAFWASGNWPNPPELLKHQIANGYVDGDPDQFFFSFLGRSGQFVIGPTSTSGSLKEYRAIPYQKLRIEPAPDFSSWVITAEDGTRYTFGAQETTTDYSVQYPASGDLGSHVGESHPSTWHLTEIRSPGGDVVTLHYSVYLATHRMGFYRELFTHVVTYPPPPEGQPCVPQQADVTNEYQIQVQRLDSIKTAAHTVKFIVGATLRADALAPGGAPQEPRLDRIVVTTATGTVLRAFQFEHDYFPGNRLRLNRVYEQDRNGVSLPPYTFTYDEQTLPPRTSFAQDHWGYYNGQTGNTTPIPTVPGPGGSVMPGADRRPNFAFMKMASLTRITYPTGGYSEFVYEANDYGSVADGPVPEQPGPDQSEMANAMGGGQEDVTVPFTVGGSQMVLAKVIVEQTPDDCAGQEWPPCPISEIVGKGLLLTSGEYYFWLTPGTYSLHASVEGNPAGNITIRVIWPGPPVPGSQYKKAGGGLRVAEVRTADAMSPLNVTVRKYRYTLQSDPTRSSGAVVAEPVYSYPFSTPVCSYFSRSSMSKMPLGEGPPIGYGEVTVWHGANTEFGKTRHTFRSPFIQGDPLPELWPFARRTSFEWKRGQELDATDFNASGQVQQRAASTHAFRDDDAEPETTRRFRGMSIHTYSAGCENCTFYIRDPFEVISAWAYVSEDTTVVFDEAGANSFPAVRRYTYGNPTHVQLTELTETNSNGTQRITRMTYPGDYAPGSGNAEAVALTAMQGAAHMHSPVIERWITERVGGTARVVRGELTTFKDFGAGKYLPYQRFIFNSPSAP